MDDNNVFYDDSELEKQISPRVSFHVYPRRRFGGLRQGNGNLIGNENVSSEGKDASLSPPGGSQEMELQVIPGKIVVDLDTKMTADLHEKQLSNHFESSLDSSPEKSVPNRSDSSDGETKRQSCDYTDSELDARRASGEDVFTRPIVQIEKEDSGISVNVVWSSAKVKIKTTQISSHENSHLCLDLPASPNEHYQKGVTELRKSHSFDQAELNLSEVSKFIKSIMEKALAQYETEVSNETQRQTSQTDEQTSVQTIDKRIDDVPTDFQYPMKNDFPIESDLPDTVGGDAWVEGRSETFSRMLNSSPDNSLSVLNIQDINTSDQRSMNGKTITVQSRVKKSSDEEGKKADIVDDMSQISHSKDEQNFLNVDSSNDSDSDSDNASQFSNKSGHLLKDEILNEGSPSIIPDASQKNTPVKKKEEKSIGENRNSLLFSNLPRSDLKDENLNVRPSTQENDEIYLSYSPEGQNTEIRHNQGSQGKAKIIQLWKDSVESAEKFLKVSLMKERCEPLVNRPKSNNSRRRGKQSKVAYNMFSDASFSSTCSTKSSHHGRTLSSAEVRKCQIPQKKPRVQQSKAKEKHQQYSLDCNNKSSDHTSGPETCKQQINGAQKASTINTSVEISPKLKEQIGQEHCTNYDICQSTSFVNNFKTESNMHITDDSKSTQEPKTKVNYECPATRSSFLKINSPEEHDSAWRFVEVDISEISVKQPGLSRGTSSSEYSPANTNRLNRLAELGEGVVHVQASLREMFREARLLLTDYQSQLKTQTLTEAAKDVSTFRATFSSLSNTFQTCQSVTEDMRQDIRDIRALTSDISHHLSFNSKVQALKTGMEELDNSANDQLMTYFHLYTCVVNEDTLRCLSVQLQDSDWRKLAQLLNIKRSPIQSILSQNSHLSDSIYHMLTSWSKRLPLALDRVEILCQTLTSIGRSDLAEELQARNDEYKMVNELHSRDTYLRKAFIAIVNNAKAVLQWKQLASFLDIRDSDLIDIESTVASDQERCLISLEKWKEQTGETATVAVLADKLRQCRYRKLAREIEKIQ